MAQITTKVCYLSQKRQSPAAFVRVLHLYLARKSTLKIKQWETELTIYIFAGFWVRLTCDVDLIMVI